MLLFRNIYKTAKTIGEYTFGEKKQGREHPTSEIYINKIFIKLLLM